MTTLETIPDHELQPQAPQNPSDTHQTPLYVLPVIDHYKLLTLPNGEVMQGMRNSVTSHERNAIQIARKYNLAVKGLGCLALPKETSIKDYGFVVEPAYKTKIPDYADHTADEFESDHGHPLELHDPKSLYETLKEQPDRQTQAAFVHAFGDFILRHTR